MGIFGSKLRRRVHPLGLTDIQNNNTLSSGSPSERSLTLSNTPISSKFVIIWLDADADNPDVVYQNSLSQLQHVFLLLHTFTNTKDCRKFLSTVKTEMIIMVISENYLDKIWSRIKSMLQIHSIYILTSDQEKKTTYSNQDYNKIRGVFTRAEPICSFFKRCIKHFTPDSFVMSIIPAMKYSKTDLQQVNQLFIYWMLAKQISLNTKYDNDAIKHFTKFSRLQYYGNSVELRNIDEFERRYHQFSPIWWYTRETFVFDMLNRGIQSQDMEIIIRMGFFIKDLYQQLEKLQSETVRIHKLPVVVYRSQNVSNEDFEKMKNIKGNLLSFNNFIMADPDYEASLNLARRARNNETGIGIVFRLKVESRLTSSSYASLQNVACSPEKGNYFLFSMHSVFRILDLKQIEERLWEVDLTLLEASNEQLLSLVELLRQETQESSSWFKLAQLMRIRRDYDHARDIYFALLELVADTDVLKMAYIYNELGVLEDERGDYASALAFYQKAIEIRQKHLPLNHRSLGISYNNMGEVQRQMGDYFNALSTHKKTLHIKQKTLPANDLSFATTYNNIGLTNELLGEFSTALEFYQKAIEIKRKALPPDHQELATTYNNIGELQRAMGNFPAALTSLEKALSIRLKKVSPTDPSLAIAYNNIGLVHQELGDFPKAVSYLEKSLDVKLKSFSPNHPSLAFSYNNIGTIHQQMGHFSQALTSYQTALDIQEKTLTPNHPEIAVTYTNIGVSHQAMANYPTARSFYQKAVDIRQKAFPPHHPLLGVSYNNLGHFHQSIGEYHRALEYYERTLKLQKKSLPSTHPALAATYNNIADIQRKLKDYDKALALYKKSLDIKKKSLTPHHPALVITYNNMGAMHQEMKNYPAALECYQQTLEIQKKTLPPEHPDLAAVYNNIGVSHQSMKQYETALDCYRKALTIQTSSLPSTHPDIATTLNSMASVLVSLGDYETALEHERRAVDIASQILPSDHPNLVTFRNYYERINLKVESMKKENKPSTSSTTL